MPVVLTAFQFAGLWIHGDALAIAPVAALFEGVALGGELRGRLGGEARFDVEDVRQVLVMEARRIDGLLDVEAAFGGAEKDVEHSGGDAWAAG